MKIGNFYVPIVENAVKILEEETENNESVSLPPILPSQEVKDPLNLSGSQSLTNETEEEVKA